MPPRRRQTRARADSDKAARREAIMQAATAVFAEQRYGAVTMQTVARAASLAKGTLYLYFPTKEELFLELTVRELTGWMRQLAGELAPGAGAAALAARIAATFVERPLLVRLLALLHGVLEQNITVEAAARFKRQLLELMRPAAAAAERIAELPPGAGRTFLLRLHAVLIGLSQMSDPSPPVARARDDNPELAVLFVELEGEVRAVAEQLLRGLGGR